MTDPVIRLDSDRISVEPGGQAQVGVTVSNPGSIVEGYRLDVVGEGPATWGQVIPAELSVYPQQEARAIVTFSPPSGTSAPSGTTAFGVRARSTVDADTSAVAEGDLEIGKVFGLQAKLIPVTSSGRWRGRHVVQLSNWGNAPAKLRLVASDPDAALGFYVRPDVVELPLGGKATVRVSVRTRKPFLRGSAVRLPFSVAAEPADAGPVTGPALPYADPSRPVVDGALNQKPILSAGFVALLGLVGLAIVGLVAFLVLRPTPTGPGLVGAGPPSKPALTVEAKGPNAVLVSWEPIEGVETYKLFAVDPESKLTLKETPVPGGQSGILVEGLQPVTSFCFALSAVRGGQESPRSDEKCTRTDEGPPPTASPTVVPTAVPSSAGLPSSNPGQSPGGQSPGGPPTVVVPPGGGASTQPGNPPPGSSPPVGQPTGPPPPSTGPYAGGKVVVVPFFVVENAGAEPQAQVRKTKLDQVSIPSSILRSRDFPSMRGSAILRAPSVLIAAGPYNSRADAEGACQQILAATGDSRCFYFQPQP